MNEPGTQNIETISPKARKRRRQYITGMVASGILVLIVSLSINVGFFVHQQAAQSQAQKQQENAKGLAKDVLQSPVCSTASPSTTTPDNKACTKAEAIAKEPTVIAGPSGPKGDPGEDGTDGAMGPSGPAGPTGAKGEAGVPGKDGSDGAAGLPGPNGTDGISGLNGKDGANGTAGEAGSKGDTGAMGAKGEVGPAGPAGPTGPAGPAGKDGKDGTDGASVASFTFTDSAGVNYSCTPNPPGSATYTCTALNPPEPTGGP